MDHHIEFRASHQQPIKKYAMKSMEIAAKKADLEGRGFDLSQIVVNGECDHPKTNGKCYKKYRVSNASHDFVLFKAGKCAHGQDKNGICPMTGFIGFKFEDVQKFLSERVGMKIWLQCDDDCIHKKNKPINSFPAMGLYRGPP